MTTTDVESAALVVVDTNVLLAATDRSRDHHLPATRLLNDDVRRLALCPQIVREYLAVSSRPLDANGLGLSGNDAVANVEQFLEGMELLSEGPATTHTLLQVLLSTPSLGKQVHDANVVAVALAHRATAIVTDDVRHFRRFSGVMAVEGLGSPA